MSTEVLVTTSLAALLAIFSGHTAGGTSCYAGPFSQPEGSLSSPGYPSSYDDYLDCTWTISVPNALNLLVVLDDIEVETCCDHLRLRDSSAVVENDWEVPKSIEVHGNEAQLTFTSDGSVVGAGWRLHWTSFYGHNCTLGGGECDQNAQCVNYNHSRICRCNPGYDGDGRTCAVKDCGPPDKEGLNCTAGSTTYLNNATCNCAVGYENDGTSIEIACLSNGTWSNATDLSNSTICTKVRCGTPPEVENSNNRSTIIRGNSYGDSVEYVCLDGYELSVSSRRAFCQANRTWSTPPTCTEFTCGNPPTVYNSDPQKIVQTGNKYLDRVIYSCMPGYEVRSGNYAITCQSSGWWSSTPSCSYGLSCGSGYYTNWTGTITSPNHPRLYSNDLNCGWRIAPDSALNIVIIVETFDVETCCDHLSIIGERSSDRVVTGTGTYDRTVTATGTYIIEANEVTVRFTSDGSVTSRGWSLRWQVQHSCTVGGDNCGINAECRNSTDAFICTCVDGYEGDGLTCLGKDCGSPTMEGVSCTNGPTRYPTNVECNCLPGFERTHSEFTLACETEGLWIAQSDNASTSCSRIRCGPPPSIPKSHGIGTGLSYEDLHTYHCFNGYELESGSGIITCQANATWSPAPTCIRVNCGSPPDVANSDIQRTVLNGTRFEDRVTFACLAGYEILSEQSFVECQADGSWSPAPTCNSKDCGVILPLEGVSCVTNSTKYPSSATCRCATGYERASQQYSIDCESSGNWSAPRDRISANCTKVDCGAPPVVDNSDFQAEIRTGTRYQDRVTYKCLPGYEERSNSTSIVCQGTKEWSTAPRCSRVNCGSPPNVTNSLARDTVISGTRYEDEVTYTCQSGYEVRNGSSSVKCESSGNWSIPPSCLKKDCGVPTKIENGALTRLHYNTTYGSEVVYKCDGHHYNMVGSPAVKCTEDGTWETPPICHEVFCGPPPTVENSKSHITGYSYNDTASYECDIGYILFGDPVIVCQVIGHWTMSPACKKLICGDPPAVENTQGPAVVTGTDIGAEARYTCKPGYEMSGDRTIECQVNQQWTARPQCNRKRCGNPAEIINADRTVFGHHLNDSAKYACHTGYKTIGEAVIYCQANGHWTVPPSCHAVDCGEPPKLDYAGLVSTSGTLYGQTATYQCLSGYTTDDPTYITCQINEMWSRVPKCVAAKLTGSLQTDSKTHSLSSSSTALIICASVLPTVAILIAAGLCYAARQRRMKTIWNRTSVNNTSYELVTASNDLDPFEE